YEGQRPIEAGATPYLLAAMSGEANIMRLLISAGADPKVRSATLPYSSESGGVTALIAAAGQGHTLAVSTVPESRHMAAVQAALENGADINETDNRGLTALHSAAYVGFDSIVQFLASHGANVNQGDKRGRTALDVAEQDIYLGAPFSQVSSAKLLRTLGGI